MLSEFIRRSRPWSDERAMVPRCVRRVLWFMLPAQLVWAVWLTTLVTGLRSCDGAVCVMATLDGRPTLLLIFSLISLAAVGFVAIRTRGLSSSNGRETAALIVAIASGGLALLGIAALLSVVGIVLATLGVFSGAMTAT